VRFVFVSMKKAVLYLIFLSLISPAYSQWQSQCIDCPPAFNAAGPDTLQHDGSGNQILANGFDHLYLIHKNGMEWELEIVDNAPNVGQRTSMKTDDSGFAHISYYDDTNNSLKYARQTSSDWSIETLDTTPNSGYGTSLILDTSNHPHIAYCNNRADHMGLYYTYFDGSSWNYETIQNEHVAVSPSIAFNASEEPCVAFFDYYERTVKYAVRSSTTWTIETLITQNNCDFRALLVIDQFGLPHVFYDCAGLHHIWNNGTNWQEEQISSTWIHGASALYDTENLLHIAWNDENGLYYGTWDGSTWITETAVVPVDTESFFWTALALSPEGLPEIAYSDNTSKQLRYCWKTGSTWQTSMISQAGNAGGSSCSVFGMDGFGHASSIDKYSHVLKYSWQDADGWQSLDLDSDSIVFYTSLDLDSNDAVHIGYYSTNPVAFNYTTNSSGSWQTTTIENDTGQYCCLKVDNFNHIHAVYMSSLSTECHYAFNNGSTWTIETLAPPTETIAGHLDLTIDNTGNPHISFFNNTSMTLGYGHRNADGWEFDMNVDSDYLSGEYTSIALSNQGYPYISYCETQSDDNLRFARWNGSQWDIILINNDPSWTGSFTSLQIDDDNYAHIACVSAGYNSLFYYYESSDGWHVSEGPYCGEENITLNLAPDNSPVITYEDSQTWDFKIASYAGAPPPTVTPTGIPTSTPTTPVFTSTPTIIPSNTPTDTPTFFATNTPTPTSNHPTSTPTETNTETPTPTVPASPTNTPATATPPTSTPTPPQPTATPPSSTPTPPQPTSTPTGSCNETGVKINMPSNFFKANDPCWCNAIVCNAETNPLENYPLFVILDVYGSLFWAPSFNTTFDNYLLSFAVGSTIVSVLPEFPWPAGTGSANGLLWYAALTDPNITDVYGTFDIFEFGWETD